MEFYMSKIANLNDLFVEQLRDRYDSANRQLAFFPTLLKEAKNPELRQIIEWLQKKTRSHLEMLDNIFLELDTDIGGEGCEATRGLIHEATEIISRSTDLQVREAGIAVSIQHLNHHDISGFGTCQAYAKTLGYKKITDTIHEMLTDEKQIDQRLSQISTTVLNEQAMNPIFVA